jgi:hypothetical protein
MRYLTGSERWPEFGVLYHEGRVGLILENFGIFQIIGMPLAVCLRYVSGIPIGYVVRMAR